MGDKQLKVGVGTYSSATLNGNWSEERFSVDYVPNTQLPSPAINYFKAEYNEGYNRPYNPDNQEIRLKTGERIIRAHPSLQPELTPEKYKTQSYESTQRKDYCPIAEQKEPFQCLLHRQDETKLEEYRKRWTKSTPIRARLMQKSEYGRTFHS
eukprot:Nk52_evm11s360 gene=Nk52_evmTU11s360